MIGKMIAKTGWSKGGRKTDSASKENVAKLISQRENPIYGEILRKAKDAQAREKYIVAIAFYDQAIDYGGGDVGIFCEIADMYIQLRNYNDASLNLREAQNLDPENAYICIRQGDLRKLERRYGDAEAFYSRALKFKPQWESAAAKLDEVRSLAAQSAVLQQEREREHAKKVAVLEMMKSSPDGDRRVDPSLFAKTYEELYRDHGPAFVFTKNGTEQKTRWGTGPTVRGVDALRGYLVSDVPYKKLQIYLDGVLLHEGELVGAPQSFEKSNPNIRKYVYNAWVDFSKFAYGWHELVFSAIGLKGQSLEGIDWRRERIIIAPPLPEGYFQENDSLIPPVDPNSALSIVKQINERPSIIHEASTHSYPGKIQNVAVLRTDQLGDVVVSVPAFLRLRELLPDANLVALVTPANAEVCRTLGVFNEVIELDFAEDAFHRHRIMDEQKQTALIHQLAGYKFDLAVDFVMNGVSRRLIGLTGAPVTIGYGYEDCKTLKLDFETYDPKSNNDVTHHSVRMGLVVKALELWLDSGAKVVRRDDLDRSILAQYGIEKDESYVLLHSGSRIKFTQWNGYVELANRIVKDLGAKVVFMAEHDEFKKLLSNEALENNKIVYMSGKIPFDHFDALISFSSVFVGNDSGPKHLAALRGTQVISLHSARIGWGEWGQEQTGVVISRKVPCAGCGLHHEPDDCAQGVACMAHIKVDEVFGQVVRFMPKQKHAPIASNIAYLA
ncbi:glycosyltransferase family 9 protein [Pararobbsia alpina]|uniref:Uncharacterized protein n=1 Tax=Pararobbsia alpina TaxID=621374 RepID=A0A6S7AYP7_9BURK|nr:glycosyltransferase family 9 protein [Pararobbsia alpina]CAB3782108.1 hypothetical protein LMG28138_01442 [Pararobbsia alpina]